MYTGGLPPLQMKHLPVLLRMYRIQPPRQSQTRLCPTAVLRNQPNLKESGKAEQEHVQSIPVNVCTDVSWLIAQVDGVALHGAVWPSQFSSKAPHSMICQITVQKSTGAAGLLVQRNRAQFSWGLRI